METRKFEMCFYEPGADECYKKVSVNQDILVTHTIQTEARDLKYFSVKITTKINKIDFSLYLYFTNEQNEVDEQLQILEQWLNEKR